MGFFLRRIHEQLELVFFLFLHTDLFNEIINNFDFNDADVNINSFLNDLHSADSTSNFVPRKIEDPLLSSSNTNMNYDSFSLSNPVQKNETSQVMDTPNTIQNVTSAEVPKPIETVVYQIADSSINSNSFVTQSSANQLQQNVLKNIAPVKMVFNNIQSLQTGYGEITDTKQTILLQNASNNTNKNITKPIIISPTLMYTGTTTTNSLQSVQLINASNGAILTTHLPVSTIVVEQEQEEDTIYPPRREGKRSTHNAIERRYRTSINDKIVELKNMLVGDAGKLNKSAILKRSIDKITDLESENYELRLENARLREVLNGQHSLSEEESSLKSLLLQKPINQHKRRYTQSSNGSNAEYSDRMTPPPTSDESNPSFSPVHSDAGSIPSPLANEEISTEFGHTDDIISAKRAKISSNETIASHGMSTISKLTLCMFMFAIVTINPLASLLSNLTSTLANNKLFEETADTSRRTILGIDTDNMNIFYIFWQRFTNSLLVLILNLIILTLCMIKLCYYSDPVMNFCSPAADQYRKQKRIADREFDSGNANAAFIAYEKCLRMFGVTLPQSYYELIPMTIWQFMRCCIHRLRFGSWINRKFSRIICSDEKQNDALNSSQELAIILNRCNQIHLSQNMRNGCGLILSMYAVNMAEVTTNIAPLTLIDIYLTAALRCRRNYMHLFSWICSRYYFYKAKCEASALCGQKLPPKYNWIFSNSYGYKFICKFSFDSIPDDSNPSLFYGDINPVDTLSLVFQQYNQHLLSMALQSLIGISCTTNSEIKSLECDDATVLNDVLNYVNLLKESK